MGVGEGRGSRSWRRERGSVAWLVALALLGGLLAVVGFAPAASTVSKPSPPSGLDLPQAPIVAGAAGSDLGYLPGSGSVSKTGQYTYTIPLEVPAGRAGVQPNLSLVYSSDAANGVLGVGWTLAGLSSITRCAQNMSVNGVAEGVHYTDYSSTPDAQRDRFCLDGQQLMVSGGGDYGGNGTQYRTEHDQNLKIVSQATSSLAGPRGPDSFTVQSPDGSTSTYTPVTVTRYAATDKGTTVDGPVRALWELTSEQDVSGNGVQYNYTTTASPDGTATQVLLASVDYTTFNGVDTSAYRHVTFQYQTRPDQEVSWASGVKSQLLVRLASITMAAPDPATTGPVWEYLIGYQSSPSSNFGRSLLTSVQRCATQGPSGKTPGAVADCT